MAEKREFLGLNFDAMPFGAVKAWLSAREAESAIAYVVTPNVDHVVRLERESSDVRQAYYDADLLLCDSRVLARLARWCGVILPVVPGSDLTVAIFADVLKRGDRICVIGASSDDAAALQLLHPELHIEWHEPPIGLRHNRAAIDKAVEFAVGARARITFLAVGSPQQELVAHKLSRHSGARGTALCIGASIDFLIGKQKRAPRLLRYIGMEWSWRLASNPVRLAHRYLVKGPRIFALAWQWQRQRLKHS